MTAIVIKKAGVPLGARVLIGIAAWLFVKHGYEVEFIELDAERKAAA